MTRIGGFNELRGFSAILKHSLGIDITEFACPPGLLARPLKSSEARVMAADGRFYLVDTKKNQCLAEIDTSVSLSKIKILISISDQGPMNMSSLNFMLYSEHAHMMLCLWDPYHRAWNDVKSAAKRARGGVWKAILELVCLFNLNYGPWGSGQWWYTKRALLEELLASTTLQSEVWIRYEELICHERRQPVPTDEKDRLDLLNSLGGIQNCVIKGPLVKLMRWFSLFECCLFWKNDFFATRLVLEQQSGHADMSQGGEEEDEPEVDQQKAKNAKDELAALKKRKGTFKIAPSLINNKNMSIKEILLSVCRSTWKCFSERASTMKSPADIMNMNVQYVGKGDWKLELVGMVDASLWREETIQHLLPEWSLHESTVSWHASFLECLLNSRSMSLTSTFCLPPLRYCHILSEDTQQKESAQALAMADFMALLDAESASHQMNVKPLNQMAWRLNPLIRTVYLAHEQDHYTSSSHAEQLHLVITKSLGDSRIIENIHQHGRDMERASKNDWLGDTKLMAHVLRSGCLEERKVEMVRATNAEKVVEDSAFMKEPIAKRLTSRGYKLPQNLQSMMLPKSKDSAWPSPTPAGLFDSVCATEWVFEYFGQNGHQYQCNMSTLGKMAINTNATSTSPG